MLCCVVLCVCVMLCWAGLYCVVLCIVCLCVVCALCFVCSVCVLVVRACGRVCVVRVRALVYVFAYINSQKLNSQTTAMDMHSPICCNILK